MNSGSNLQAESALLEGEFGTDKNSQQRIHDYYLPVYQWLNDLLVAKNSESALIVGINGQQGCGKSTLCHHLCELFKLGGRKAVTISVDDFYLTNSEQKSIAEKHAGNCYLQPRGYPGTHDLALAIDSLTAAKRLKQGEQMHLPRYDKSAFSGQGDRFPPELWSEITGPVDLILFEGWMLGYSSKPDLSSSDKNMLQINEILNKYGAWNELLDAFIHLDSDRIDNVVSWRVEAEMNMKATGKGGMSREEVEAYVRLFLPCYEVYLPWLRANPPVQDHHLRIQLAQDRLPV
jgi:D-glycerate 3-kinase